MLLTKLERQEWQQKFAAYLHATAEGSGYDLDGPRSGGRQALAKQAGMSPASIGRILAGQSLPDPYSLECLADALGVPYWEIFEQAGVVIAGTLRPREPKEKPQLTVDAAARELGITKPAAMAAFKAMVVALQDTTEG